MQRRSFLAALCAAPAIVRSESLMKIIVPKREIWHTGGIVRNESLDVVVFKHGCSVGKTEAFDEFIKMQLRHIAQGIGLSFEQLAADIGTKSYRPFGPLSTDRRTGHTMNLINPGQVLIYKETP